MPAPTVPGPTAVPCDQCGYDLRGLPPDGRCPECGRPIAWVLAALKAAASRFQPDVMNAAQRSRVQWAEGLAATVAAAATAVGVILAPSAMYRRHTVARLVLLAFTVTGWVLTGSGMWKVARTDPAVDRPASRPVGPVLLRIAAGLYTLFPALVVFDPMWPADLVSRYAILLTSVTSVAAVLFMLRILRLSLAAHSRWIGVQAVVLCGLIPVEILLIVADMRYSNDLPSLELVLLLPNPTCASTWVPAMMLSRPPGPWWIGLFTMVPLSAVEVLVVMLWKVWRATTPAGTGGGSGASSRP